MTETIRKRMYFLENWLHRNVENVRWWRLWREQFQDTPETRASFIKDIQSSLEEEDADSEIVWFKNLAVYNTLRNFLKEPETEQKIDSSQVTRVEVIDQSGRAYTNYWCSHVEVQFQDNNRTIKVFLKTNSNETTHSL